MSYPDQASSAEVLALGPAMALVVVLAGTRRWQLLWLGMAALLGVLMQITWLVLLARSF